MPLDRAWCYDVITGDIYASIDGLAGGSVAQELNKASAFTLSAPWDALSALPRKQWTYPHAGIILGWTRPDGTVALFDGGPISDEPEWSVKGHTVSIPFADTWSMLGLRTVRGWHDFGPGDEGELARVVAEATAISLGSIAEVIVQWGCVGPNGGLPIAYDPALWQTTAADADHTRAFKGFDLANNTVDKLLSQLSSVIGGPDIVFEPRWREPGECIEFLMRHGIEGQPNIPQTSRPLFDAAATDSPVSTFRVVQSDQLRGTRYYATGAGEGEGMLIAIAQDAAAINAGAPLRERITSHQSVERIETLRAHATGDREAGRRPITQIDLTVNGDDPTQPFGSYRLGELATFRVEGHPFMADGDHLCKITKISAGIGSSMLTVSLQEFTA